LLTYTYLISASLPIRSACSPVSSLTSRRAVCSGVSPASIAPFGKARIAGATLLWLLVDFLGGFLGRSMCGSIIARNQRPRILRSTTPPAETSRTMGLSANWLVWQTQALVTTGVQHPYTIIAHD